MVLYTHGGDNPINYLEATELENFTAIYKGKCRDKNGYAVHLFYEYRGREYMITDEHNGYSETMKTKHRIEQERIDKLIDESDHGNGNSKPFDIDEIFSILGWD